MIRIKFLPFWVLLIFMMACQTNGSQENSTADIPSVSEETRSEDLAEGIVLNPSWSKNAVIYEVNIRQYTPEGSFIALAERLPELKRMGVDILWMMPVQPIGKLNRKGNLGSYYSIADYVGINPEYGDLEDFKTLVQTAHSLEMKVLLDWVANHTAWDHLWTKSHPEWYKRNEAGQFMPPVKDWSDVIDLDYENPEMQIAMLEAMEYWVRETDIDGFRCDVANLVPLDFWLKARASLNAIKPVFMLAETDDPAYHAAFEMTYSWELYHLFNDIAQGRKNAGDLALCLKLEADSFPRSAYRMLFTSNHDENSWDGSCPERMGEGAESFAVLSYMLPGMPLIYSGQEAGLDKRLSFFEKDPIIWRAHRMRRVYQVLNELKEQEPALWNGAYGGSLIRIPSDNDALIYALMRQKDDSRVFAIFNLSPAEQEVRLSGGGYAGLYRNVFSGQELEIAAGEVMSFEPWGYGVLVN